jgi:hypothetical protein
MALTDISGIGSKTAEKLRKKGITSKQELFRRFKNRDTEIVGGAGKSGLNKRALDGIRDALFEQEQTFTDPVMGVTVGPENETATKKLGTKTLGDLPSVDVTQANAGDGGNFYADQTLGELAEPAAEGQLGSKGAPQSVIGWAADAAANLGVSDLGSGQIQDVNKINKNAGGFETTAPGVAKRNQLPEEATEQYDLDALLVKLLERTRDVCQSRVLVILVDLGRRFRPFQQCFNDVFAVLATDDVAGVVHQQFFVSACGRRCHIAQHGRICQIYCANLWSVAQLTGPTRS